MVKANVYSLPVYSDEPTNFTGVLTIDGVVRAIVDLFVGKAGIKNAEDLGAAKFSAKDVQDVTYAFNGLSVSDGNVEPREPLPADTPLADAVAFPSSVA